MSSDTFENVPWRSELNPIVMVVGHSRHSEKTPPPTKRRFCLQHVASPPTFYSLYKVVFAWRHLGATAIFESCMVLTLKSIFAVLLSDLSEISSSFLMLLRGFLLTHFLVASIILLLRIERMLPGIGFGEGVCCI